MSSVALAHSAANSVVMLSLSNIAVILLDGLRIGVMLVLISAGLTLIFGFLGVVNFAHGAFFMLGSYLAITVVESTGSFLLALLVAPLVVALLGVVTEVILLRPTYKYGAITQLLLMIGLSLLIEGGVLLVWGDQAKNLASPALLQGGVALGEITYPVYNIAIIAAGSLLVVIVWLLLEYTYTGLVIRASLTDKTMMRSLGSNIPLIYMLVFAGGVMLTGLAGTFMAPVQGVNPTTGGNTLLDAFIVVIMGGLGSFRGTVIAGLSVGVLEVLISRYVSFRLSGLVVFILLVVVLLVRPHGLFGQQGVLEE